MKVEVVKFEAEDMDKLLETEAMAYLKAYLPPDNSKLLAKEEHSWTMKIDDQVVLCAGVVKKHETRGEAWAVVDKRCRREFLHVHNAVKRFYEICPVRRVEAYVDVGFLPGHRWVKALGFKLEAEVLKAYRPGGGDVSLYARVR